LVLAAKSVADEDDLVWDVAASGFRDTSRIAASDVKMMLDILMTNQEAVIEMLTTLETQIGTLKTLLNEETEAPLQEMLLKAHHQRRALY
jgi:prephenate dehydrogenase